MAGWPRALAGGRAHSTATAALLLFAHRGGMAHAPENTLTAFRLALELGANGLESDVWLTADGVPVLDHDGRVGRGPGAIAIGDLGRAQLPAHIPTLDDLYDACGTGFELALDVCDRRPAPAAVAAAAARGDETASRLWLCAGDPGRLTSWRDLDSRPRLVLSSRDWRRPREPAELAARRLAGLGVDALNLPARKCTAAVAQACHREGLQLLGWGVRSGRTARRLARIGVDGIMGDDVGALARGLHAALEPAF